MHILVLPSWYPTKESPNSGSFFREQALALSRFGHQVSVLVIQSSDTGKTVLEKNSRGPLTEYCLSVKKLPFHMTAVSVMWKLIRLFHKEFRSQPVDIIHVHSYRSGRYARFLRGIFGIPYVVTEHFSGFQRGGISDREQNQARRVFRGAAAILTVSPGLRQAIAPLCPREVRVIPNMVSAEFFSGGLREVSPQEDFHFVSTGYMNQNKGFDVLLRAFAQVHEQAPKATLTLIGGGDPAPFQALARELGISPSVRFTGLISREEVARYLRSSQAFVLLSRVETFGICFLEAMACGLPIVMTKTDAWELLATASTGLAVDVDDEQAAAEAMLGILDHYDAYDPEGISAYCRKHFSEEMVCRQLTELYTEVLGR